MSISIDKIKYVSYSEVITNKLCPLKWFLEYMKGLREGENVYGHIGSLIHDAVYKNLIDKNSLSWISMGKNIIRWIKKNPEDKWRELNYKEWVQFAFEIYENIFSWLSQQFGEYEVLSGELELYEPIEGTDYYFKGFVDLIIHRKSDDTYHILDFKTTVSGDWDDDKRKKEEVKYQVLLYKRFFSQMTNIPLEQIEVHFVLMKTAIRKKRGRQPVLRGDKIELITITSGQNNLDDASKWLKTGVRMIDKGFQMKKRNESCFLCHFNKTENCP